jgi:hypothetical protein
MAETGVCTAGAFSYITGVGDISAISVGTWVGRLPVWQRPVARIGRSGVLGHWICMQLFWETAWNGTDRGIITNRRNEPYNFRNAISTARNGIWLLELMGFLIIWAGAFFGLRAAAREAQSLGTRARIIAAKLLLLSLLYTNVVFNHTALAFVGTVLQGVLAASDLKAGQAAHLPEPVALRTKGGQHVRKT